MQTADEQISDLIALLGAADEAALRAPCAGREKLGDGTVAAIAMHAADNYHRIAEYLIATTEPRSHTPPRRHHIPSFRGAHSPRGGADHGAGGAAYRADDIDSRRLLERLATARARLTRLAELSDERLAAVPPAGDIRFADGERTLEQIVAGLLNHQRHQCEALAVALAGARQGA